MSHKHLSAIVVCGAFLALSFPADAQITTASLEGVVRDPTGAVIAGARVQVTNAATNVVLADVRQQRPVPGAVAAAGSLRNYGTSNGLQEAAAVRDYSRR